LKFRRKELLAEDEIPTGSMGDIAFLLIIFFMLTTVFSKDRGLKMELPETMTQEELTVKTVLISIQKGGKITVDGAERALSELQDTVLEIKARSPSKFVTIKSDKNAKYGIIMDVMDELMEAGIKDIALPTEQEKKKK
jgi:biopolymer transport protein ExbD